MRAEEKQTLLLRLVWFALAIFIVFFAYGELHELEKEKRSIARDIQVAQLELKALSEDKERSIAKQKTYDEVMEMLCKFEKQVPRDRDIHFILPILNDLANKASVQLQSIGFSKSRNDSQVLLKVKSLASYKSARLFLGLVESCSSEDMPGLKFFVDRFEMVERRGRLELSMLLQIPLRG